uniref:(California timema) hypothetical protein n=1 Tax=Timema californicum TaxID=61474 RepID=A0A7R9PBR2_TIMCA|nr:unnamed protein product [Timema californicum]
MTKPSTEREKAPLEENGGGGKPFNNRPLRDQEPSSDGSWRGKGQVKQASPAETQSSPRGRGRGVRGGRSMTTAEFVPTSSRTLPAKSVSETRTTPPQIEGDMDNYPSQVIIPSQDNLSRDIGRMSLSEPAQTNNREYQNQRRPNKNNPNFYQNNERRQAVVPPRLQESAANRPKRYSSLRQRVVQETGIPQQTYPQPHSFYQTAFIAPPVYTEATQQLPAPTTPPLQLIPAPLSQPPPPPYAASFPSPPTFIQPAPPTFIAAPAPGPPIINFVTPGPQGQFAAQLTPQPYPPFQGYAAVAPAQPPELYQPQGGITYYSPEEQIIPRPIAQKRQRAAIPIVPPPERSPRGRGRTQEEQVDVGMPHDGSGDAQLSEQFEDATTTQDIDVRHDQFNMAGDCGVPLPAVSTNIEQDTLA